MTPHTTHFADCGCGRAKMLEDIRILQMELSEAQADYTKLHETMDKVLEGMSAENAALRSQVEQLPYMPPERLKVRREENEVLRAEVERMRKALGERPTMPEPKWIARCICCGLEDGFETFDTWENADRFREQYTSGPAVARHGFSAPADEVGHRRAVIIERVDDDA